MLARAAAPSSAGNQTPGGIVGHVIDGERFDLGTPHKYLATLRAFSPSDE